MKSMGKSILVFSDWFDPAYKAGGPVRSLLNLTTHWPFATCVFTSNEDLDHQGSMEGVKANQWVERSKNVRVFYQSASHRSLSALRKVILSERWGAFYINSLFSIWFSILPLLILKSHSLSHRVVLAPRGMLHEGAFNQKKNKKSFFVWLGKRLGLWKGILWHATSELEKQRILSVIGNNAKVVVFPNIPSVLPRQQFPSWNPHRQRWLLVSRISPEKGIMESIEWIATSPHASKIELIVIGPIENKGYYEQCLRCLTQFPTFNVQFKGDLPAEEIQPYRESCHLFFSSTKGENYGHAIAEAILSGMPVIITNTTAWKDLGEAGIGWDVEWTKEAFQNAIEWWWRLDENEYVEKLNQIRLFRERWWKEQSQERDWNKMFPF
jgi:glycosyltransferase involved in cell wall biosynthesis